MRAEHEYATSQPFDDAKNITVGNARVIYAQACGLLMEGWVLPGGRRTDSFAVAHMHAVRMDALMGGKS